MTELEASNVKATVDVDAVTGAKGEDSGSQRRHGSSHIVGLSPATLWTKSLGNQLVILFFHRSRHIAGNDSGTNFKDIDALFC